MDEPLVSSTPVEPAIELTEPEETVSAHTPDAGVVLEPPADEVGAEPFVLVAQDEAVADAKEPESSTALAALEQADQLALPLTAVSGDDETETATPAPSETPSTELPSVDETRAETLEAPRVEQSTSHTSLEIAEPERPVAVETRPSAEVARPRESDPKTEIRTSLFARLFQSVRRPSADLATRPARWDEKPQESAPKSVDAKPAQPLATPSAYQPEPQQSDPKPSGEITARTADWLADFSAQAADDLATPAGDTPLEPIAWPSQSRVADDDATPVEDVQPTETPAEDDRMQAVVDSAAAELAHVEAVTPLVDAAEHIQTPTAGDELQAVIDSAPETTDAGAIAQDDVATPVVDVAAPIEFKEPAVDAADSPVANPSTDVAPVLEAPLDVPTATADESPQPVTATPVAADAPSAEVQASGDDEFASKADRLSYLLAKLEQAMQAKAAASATPSEEQAAPVAHYTAPSRPADVAVDSAPQTPASEPAVAVEYKIEEPQQPVEHTPQADQQGETPAPVAEAITAPVEPIPTVEAEPVVAREPEAEPVRIEVAIPAVQETTEGQLKPERLSFLLNKLFEATKRQSVAQPAEPQQAESAPAREVEPAPREDAAHAHPAESEILDLRGPHPIPEPADEPDDSSVAIAPVPPQDSPTLEVPTPADAPIVAPEPLEQAPVDADTKPAEITQPVASPSEPVATAPAVAQEAMAPQPQPSEQPVAPRRSRPAEPATHFGSRSRPPRPGLGHKTPCRSLRPQCLRRNSPQWSVRRRLQFRSGPPRPPMARHRPQRPSATGSSAGAKHQSPPKPRPWTPRRSPKSA